MTAPRAVGTPETGYFLVRLVKGGPLVPARIWRPCTCTVNGGGDDAIDPNAVHDWQDTCDRYPPLCAKVDGKVVEVQKLWNTVCARLGTEDDIIGDSVVANMIGRWVMEITAKEFEFARNDLAWCREHDPDASIKNLAEYYRVDQMEPIF